MRTINIGKPMEMSLNIQDVLASISRISPTAASRVADPRNLLNKLLSATMYGSSNVIKIGGADEDITDASGAVIGSRFRPSFIFNVTGEETEDFGEAMNKAAEMGIVNYTRLSKDPSRAVGRQLNFGELVQENKTINMMLKRAKLNPTSAEARSLREAGLGKLIDDLELTTIGGRTVIKNPFEITSMALKTAFTGDNMSDALARVRGDDGLFKGMVVPGDDGFQILKFGLPGMDLNEKEIAALKSLMNTGQLQKSTLIEALKKGEGGLEKQLGKVGKRQKTFASARQISISGVGITGGSGATGFLGGVGTLEEAIEASDTRAQALMASLSGKVSGALKDDLEKAFAGSGHKFYGTFDLSKAAGDEFLDTIFKPGARGSASAITTMAGMMRDAVAAAGPDGNVTKEFEKIYKAAADAGHISEKLKNQISATLSGLETSVDGAFYVNRKYLERSVQDWSNTVLRYERNMASGVVMGENAQETYLSLRQQLRTIGQEVTDKTGKVIGHRLKDDIESYDFSGRTGFHDTLGNRKLIKGRMYVSDDLPDDIGFLTPDIMIKSETGFEEFINFDTTGGGKRPPDAIAPDFQMAVFHSGEFLETAPDGSRVVPAMTRRYQQELQAELEQITRTGIIPANVRQRLIQDMESNSVDEFMAIYQPHKMGSKEANKEMVRKINNAILENNVTDVDTISAISNYYRKQMFSQKNTRPGFGQKTVRIPNMPDLQRYNIESEASRLSGQPGEARMLTGSRGFSRSKIMDESGALVDLRLMTTRAHQHSLLFSGRASVEHQAALGGFDFDDKGMPILKSYQDYSSGTPRKKLALFTTRQPTGPMEYVVQDFLKDQETLNEIFGHNKSFMAGLEEVATSGDTEAMELLEYMRMVPDSTNAKRFGTLHRKYAGVGVTGKDIAAGRFFGSADSKLLPASNSYFSQGQDQATRVIESVYQHLRKRSYRA
jgi:hypothetical protein